MTIQKTYASIDEFHTDLILLTRWLADQQGATADEIADAVEKPWHYTAEIGAARVIASLPGLDAS